MNEPNELMDRIRNLERWQERFILIEALHMLDEVELQGIKEKIEEFEGLKEDN